MHPPLHPRPSQINQGSTTLRGTLAGVALSTLSRIYPSFELDPNTAIGFGNRVELLTKTESLHR